jgi:hypothetical protein
MVAMEIKTSAEWVVSTYTIPDAPQFMKGLLSLWTEKSHKLKVHLKHLIY